jgi:Dolichyl-phosphate-mannose-protein mannosyltransferase
MPKTTAMESSARSSVQARRTVRQRTDWPLVFVLLGAATYLYLNLFALPNTPFLLSGDQVYFWMDAQRMLHGERIYLDFFQFTPPGTDLLYAALFKLFGPRVWVTNAAVLALGVAFCWLCFSLSRKLMERRPTLLATVLFMVFVYGKSLNGTNHWFAILAVVAAVNVSIGKTNPVRIAVAGALLGLASFFNQAHGAAALLAFTCFLLWEHTRTKSTLADLFKMLALLLLGFSTVLLLLSAHFIAETGLKALLYFQVRYVLQYAVRNSQSLLGLPSVLTWRTLPSLIPSLLIYSLLPIVYGISLWQCWHQRKNPSFPWDRVALLSLVGFFLLIEVALSANWLRLYAVSLPGIILLVWMLDRMQKIRRYAAILILILAACIAARQVISIHATYSSRAELPGGRVATTPQAYEKLLWVKQHTQPGEFFLQAAWPGMYLPLQLRNPLYMATLSRLDDARPEDIELAIQQLKTKPVQFVLWAQFLDSQCGSGPCEVNVLPIRDYLHSSYTRIRTFPDGDTLWQRSE